MVDDKKTMVEDGKKYKIKDNKQTTTYTIFLNNPTQFPLIKTI